MEQAYEIKRNHLGMEGDSPHWMYVCGGLVGYLSDEQADALDAAAAAPSTGGEALPEGVHAIADGRLFLLPTHDLPHGWRWFDGGDWQGPETESGPISAEFGYEVRPVPAAPEPEMVPWHEALGRKIADGRTITAVGRSDGHEPWFEVNHERGGSYGADFVDPSGLVAVLPEGGQG